MENNNGRYGQVLEFDSKPFTPPQPEQFDGAEILDEISSFIRRYVHLSDHQARIVAVWAAHTHAISAATATPYLCINSATKQAGKTRLLEVFELLVCKPWLTGRVTAACLVRKVDQVRPTLLLDESDAAFSSGQEYAEALRGILNTGYQIGGTASCCVGQGANIAYKDFKTYCAKAIAGIGNSLPETVFDRSIPIRLQRKRPGEVVARFRRRYAKAEAADLKTKLSDWMTSIIPQIKDAEPTLPEELTDRQQDGIEPLLAIADVAGGEWPDALRKAAVEVFGSQAAEDQNIGVRLLKDIKSIFDADGDKISTADLISKLREIEISPWADWSKGKGLSPNGLSKLLKPFDISPRPIRFGEKLARGYLKEWFEDAWERYLGATPSYNSFPDVTPSQPAQTQPESDFSTRNTKADVTPQKSASDLHKHCVVTPVTPKNPPYERVAQKGGEGDIKNLTSCPKCGSFAVDPRVSPPYCFTCEKSAS